MKILEITPILIVDRIEPSLELWTKRLGFEITEHVGRSGRPGSVGEFGWGGAYFTKFWVDPQERLVVVFMAQLLPARGLDLQDKFRALVYQSLMTSAAWPPVARRP